MPKQSYTNTLKKTYKNDFYQPNYKEHLITTYRQEFRGKDQLFLQDNQHNKGRNIYNRWNGNHTDYQYRKVRRDFHEYYDEEYYPKFYY